MIIHDTNRDERSDSMFIVFLGKKSQYSFLFSMKIFWVPIKWHDKWKEKELFVRKSYWILNFSRLVRAWEIYWKNHPSVGTWSALGCQSIPGFGGNLTQATSPHTCFSMIWYWSATLAMGKRNVRWISPWLHYVGHIVDPSSIVCVVCKCTN